MTRITTLGKALNVLSFYRWAFGDLTEQDSDIGMLAEYLVGDILNCLTSTRKVQAPFDLIMKDGTTIEVKATTHKREKKGRTPYYCWDVSTQSEMLKGNRPIADYWVFLIADFPRDTSRTPRVVQAFDLHAHGLPHLAVQMGEGLVHQQQLRAAHDGAGDIDALLLAA